MKTITPQEFDSITDLRSEGLTALQPGVIEKDLLVTEALQVAVNLHNPDIRPVFCGGTCLSKAHRLINRMSEDIDFKLVVTEGLSRSGKKRALSRFKRQLVSALQEAGFEISPDGVRARNENKYIEIILGYKSQFEDVYSMRPEVKVELSALPPLLPTASFPVCSMMDELAGKPRSDLEIECIGYAETLSEKVLSFLRRTAEHRAGRTRGQYDERLIRHIYDVHSIITAHPKMQLPVDHFAGVVAGDAAQFQNQYPEFAANAIGEMQKVLEELKSGTGDFERYYGEFVDELVFGRKVPFSEACSSFSRVAESFLQSLEPALKQEALSAWEAYQENGLHLSSEEADAWLAKLEAGEDVEPPKCHV